MEMPVEASDLPVMTDGTNQLWAATYAADGTMEHKPINVPNQIPCEICAVAGIVAYANCAFLYVDSGIRGPGQQDIVFPRDFGFCQECAVLAERQDLEALVERRLAADPRQLGLRNKNATREERYPVAQTEFAALLEALDGRELITPATSDFRLGIRTGFAPGTLTNITTTDGRNADCHQWIEEQGPINFNDYGSEELAAIGLNNKFERFKQAFRHIYSYAIPSRSALDAAARYSPNGVLDFGAGNGYWTYLLQGRGIDVRAIDESRLQANSFWTINSNTVSSNESFRSWSPVTTGTARNVSKANAKRSLLLVWPPHRTAMAHDAILAFRGEIVIYVGEWRRTTADAAFHDELKRDWRRIESIAIPTIFGYFDRMRIYARR